MTAVDPPSPCRGESAARPDLPITVLRLGEEQNESDDETEDAETFGERRADEGAGELAVGSRRLQGAREEVAEDVANAQAARPMPMQARPAPRYLKATGSIVISLGIT